MNGRSGPFSVLAFPVLAFWHWGSGRTPARESAVCGDPRIRESRSVCRRSIAFSLCRLPQSRGSHGGRENRGELAGFSNQRGNGLVLEKLAIDEPQPVQRFAELFSGNAEFVGEIGEALGTACLFIIRPTARAAANELSGGVPAGIIVWSLTGQSKHAFREREQPLRNVIALHCSSIQTRARAEQHQTPNGMISRWLCGFPLRDIDSGEHFVERSFRPTKRMGDLIPLGDKGQDLFLQLDNIGEVRRSEPFALQD